PPPLVISQNAVQPRVVAFEMPREPRVEPIREQSLVDALARLEVLHDIAQLIEQTLVVALVLSELVIAALAHQALLQREMRRYRLEQIAEEIGDGVPGPLRGRLRVEAVDQFDQFPVLMIDGGDTDAVAVFPVQQAHDPLLNER